MSELECRSKGHQVYEPENLLTSSHSMVADALIELFNLNDLDLWYDCYVCCELVFGYVVNFR